MRVESSRYVRFEGEPKQGKSYLVPPLKFRGPQDYMVYVDELSQFFRRLLGEPPERERLESYIHDARKKEGI